MENSVLYINIIQYEDVQKVDNNIDKKFLETFVENYNNRYNFFYSDKVYLSMSHEFECYKLFKVFLRTNFVENVDY